MKEANSDKHLTYFKVEGFKNFSSLELNDIGLFNVIIGDNNIGKTNLLEALCFEENDYSKYLYYLAMLCVTRFKLNSKSKISMNYLDNYFHNSNKKFKIEYRTNKLDNYFSIEYKPKDDLTDKQVEEVKQLNLNQITSLVLDHCYMISDNNKSNIYTTNYSDHKKFDDNEKYMPFISTGHSHGEDLNSYYSEIIAPNKAVKNQVIEFLKVFDEKIDYLDLGNSKTLNSIELLIGFENESLTQPLSMFGDGFIKYFRILLEVLLTKNEHLMIDEIDNGIHHSKQAEFIKKIVLLAIENKTQIFCTTHSKECLNAIKEAFESDELKEHQINFRCFSLAKNKKGDVKAFNYDYKSFASDINLNNELR